MDHSRTAGFWVETRAAANGCSYRWAEDVPRCGAPVTLHVQAESAIYGGVCLDACEPHAPQARTVGVYLDEHSPSFPGCRCTLVHDQPRPQFGVDDDAALPFRPEARVDLRVDRPGHRAPYNAELDRHLRRSLGISAVAGDGYTHYPAPSDGEARSAPLCGAGKYFSRAVRDQYVLSPNWSAVSCPTCRRTETR